MARDLTGKCPGETVASSNERQASAERAYKAVVFPVLLEFFPITSITSLLTPKRKQSDISLESKMKITAIIALALAAVVAGKYLNSEEQDVGLTLPLYSRLPKRLRLVG
jgi:hypothetical protein